MLREGNCIFRVDDPLDLESLQAESFVLASLTFDTLPLGTSPLNITSYTLGDAYGNPLSADLYSGSINVVPEPTPLLLVGSGLAGIGFWRRKKLFCDIISKKKEKIEEDKILSGDHGI